MQLFIYIAEKLNLISLLFTDILLNNKRKDSRVRKKLAIFPIILTIIILIGMALYYMNSQNKKPLIGGPCLYSDYSGIATITKVKETERSKRQVSINGGPGYEGYEIWFTFRTDEKIKQKWAKPIAEREHLYLLMNGWCPGPRYVKKYNIKTGEKYKCTFKVIMKGTCSPILFDFDRMKRDDYFESGK